MSKKIEPINVFDYPENLGNRFNECDKFGNIKFGNPPLEYALLEKVNELVDAVNRLKEAKSAKD